MPLPFTFWTDRQEIDRRRNNPEFAPETGMSHEELRKKCFALAGNESKSRTLRKAETVAFILDNARLEVSPLDLFAVDRSDDKGIIEDIRNEWMRELSVGNDTDIAATADVEPCGAYSGSADFGHTCPDWESLYTLGIPGIISRLEAALSTASEDTREFYSASLIAYRAMGRLCLRFAEAYARHADKSQIAAQVAENCRAISDHAPENLMQALTLAVMYYRTQWQAEGTIPRSFGRLDKLIAPFYVPSEETDEVLRYFFERLNDKFFHANHPFTLGGTDIAGDERYSRIALNILEVYAPLDIPSPKIQLRIADNTPDHLITKACEMIKNGTNSIVFCNDRTVTESFLKNGHTTVDAENYVMIGCYEPSTIGREISCTCAGNVILPKAVECALNGGRDIFSGKQVGLPCPDEYADFEHFFTEVKRQAVYFAEQSMRRIMAYEKYMHELNPSPLLSGSMKCCIESGKDVYGGGAAYNFTSVNVFGIATAVDSLMAVKKLVFDDKLLSLSELRCILINNWEGQEKLRLRAQNKCPKYGCGFADADTVAAELMSSTVGVINGSPNNRGGYFRAGAFSVDSRYPFGKCCAASANGRLAHEPLSKNMSATDGADQNGVTALIESACAIDYTDIPNGTVLDVVLHRSAAEGADGTDAIKGLVRTFINKGGFAIQINVLDPSVLRLAQAEPEKYKNLQIRLCGWNVHFVNLKPEVQEEFIQQSEV